MHTCYFYPGDLVLRRMSVMIVCVLCTACYGWCDQSEGGSRDARSPQTATGFVTETHRATRTGEKLAPYIRGIETLPAHLGRFKSTNQNY